MISDKHIKKSGFSHRRWLNLLGLSFIIYHLASSLAGAQNQTGIASFYAKRATGSMTASGERLHHDSMTCAHRTLPFGTLLKVTHMKNNKWVIVKVNDRGPFVKTRIIDLSWGAARELGMINEGLAKVYIELAEEIVIPLRPGKHHYEVPRLILDIDADTVKPVWQHELEIDHRKMHQRMKRTAQKTLFERLRKRIDW